MSSNESQTSSPPQPTPQQQQLQILKIKIGTGTTGHQQNENQTSAVIIDAENVMVPKLSSSRQESDPDEPNETSSSSSSSSDDDDDECEYENVKNCKIPDGGGGGQSDIDADEDDDDDEDVKNKMQPRPPDIKINLKLDSIKLSSNSASNDKSPAKINSPLISSTATTTIGTANSPENKVYYVKILPKDNNQTAQAAIATISASTLKISTTPTNCKSTTHENTSPPQLLPESLASTSTPLSIKLSATRNPEEIPVGLTSDAVKGAPDNHDLKVDDEVVDSMEINLNDNEHDESSSTHHTVKKVKMSRELKQLKKLQNSSKILSQFISESEDSNSKQRKSRKSHNTTKLTTTSLSLLNDTIGSGVGADDDVIILASKNNRRSRSRSQSTSRNTNLSRSNSIDRGDTNEARMKRTMRSQNVEFVQKQQKFLTRIQSQQDSDGTFNSDDENMELSFNKPLQDNKQKFNLVPLKEIFPAPKLGNDKFCWRCHQIGSVSNTMIACSKCVRSYHGKCARMGQMKTTWICHECTTVETAEKSSSAVHAKITIDELAELLNFALKRMKQLTGAEEFTPMFNSEIHANFEEYIVNPIDLMQLQINIDNRKYKSTDAFLSDAQWLLHNILIYFSDSPKLIQLAKIIFKICKQEMYEIETCHECYYNANSCDDWFTEVCSKPHILLWAKLKSFPYWPAKAMIVNSAQLVSVRFFGDHDRAWVPVKDCFLYSKMDPNTLSKYKRNNIAESIKEVDFHINKIITKFGSFNYAGLRTPFDPSNTIDQLLTMIPTYADSKIDGDPAINFKSKLTYKIVKTADNNLSISPISTISSSSGVTTGDKKSSPSNTPSPMGMPTKLAVKKSNDHENRDSMMSMPEKQQKDVAATCIMPNKITIERKNIEDGQKTYHVLKKKSSSFDKKTEQKDAGYDSKNGNDEGKLKRFVIKRKSDNWNMIPLKKKKHLGPDDAKTPPVKINCGIVPTTPTTYSYTPSKISKRKKSIDVANVSATNAENKKKSNLESVNIGEEDENVSKHVESKRSKKTKRISDEDEAITSDSESEALLPIEEIKVESIEDDDITSSSNVNCKNNDLAVDALRQTSSNTNILINQDAIKSEPISDDDLPHENDSTLCASSSSSSSKRIATVNNVENNKIIEIPHLQPITFSPSKGFVTVKDINKMKMAPHGTDDKITIIDKSKKSSGSVYFSSTANNSNSSSGTRDKRDVYKLVSIKTQRARKSFPASKIKPHLTPTTMNSNNCKADGPTPSVVNTITGLRSAAAATSATLISTSTNKNSTNMVYIPIDPKNLQNHQLLDFNKFVLPHTTSTVVTCTKNAEYSIATISTAAPTVTSTVISPIPTNITATPIVITTGATTVGTSSILTDHAIGFTNNNNNTTTIPCIVSGDQSNVTSTSPQHMMTNLVTKNLASAITETIVRTPPKLHPKPIGPLRTVSDAEISIPLDTGPLSRKLMDNAHKMTDYFRSIIEDTIGDLSNLGSLEAKVKSLEIELERNKFNHNQEVSELKHNTDVILCEMRNTMEKEKTRIVNETKKQCELERIRAIEETKRKQWCANCSKEAQFYCCWNTSYCDYPCQQKHWPRHMISCAQQNESSRSTEFSNKFNSKSATSTSGLSVNATSKERLIKPKEMNPPPKIINTSYRGNNTITTPRNSVPLQRLVSINGSGTPCYTIVHTRPTAQWEMLNTVRSSQAPTGVLLTGTSNITGVLQAPVQQNGSLMENLKLVPPETFVINQQNMVASKSN